MVTVHKEPLLARYRAPRCSPAFIWRIFALFTAIGISVLATFATQGLWHRVSTFVEQPQVRFTDQCMFSCFDGSLDPNPWFWSPFPELNGLVPMNRLLVVAQESNHRDLDGDGRVDELQIRVAFPHRPPPNNASSISFSSCTFALFFDVLLDRRALVELKRIPIIGQIDSTRPFNQIHLLGDLELVQSELFPASGNLSFGRWAPTIGPEPEHEPQLLDWQLRRWTLDQNFSIALARKTQRIMLLDPLSANDDAAPLFLFTLRARVHEQLLHYRTSAWELLKGAWIQFLAIFLIVRFLFGRLSSFLFKNQIIGTVLALDGSQNGHHKMH